MGARLLTQASWNCLDDNRMNTKAISELQYSDKAAKRAQNEEMEFDVPTAGVVVVTNVSHDSAHSVNVEDGVPVGCSCKADQYHQGACKHRVAVAINAPVLEAASASRSDGTEKRALADGGTVVSETKPPESDVETTHADGCENPECEGLASDADRPLLSFECWEVWASS